MNTKINDGGHAFPDSHQDGMTLRDYFAAKAMQGFLSKQGAQGSEIADTVESNSALCANWAYSMADAMLEERKSQ